MNINKHPHFCAPVSTPELHRYFSSTKLSENRRLEHVQSQHLSNQEQMWCMSVQSQTMMIPKPGTAWMSSTDPSLSS